LLAGPSDDVDLLGGAALAANQYRQASRVTKGKRGSI
jgi:hypothetical protein